MFKWFGSLALFAVVGLAQAQPVQGAVLRAAAEPAADRGSFSASADPAAAGLRDGVPRREPCAGRDEAACTQGAQRDGADGAAAATMTPGLSLMWAALGVVAFVALRRRPRS